MIFFIEYSVLAALIFSCFLAATVDVAVAIVIVSMSKFTRFTPVIIAHFATHQLESVSYHH